MGMEWFIDAYGDSFVVAPTAAGKRPSTVHFRAFSLPARGL